MAIERLEDRVLLSGEPIEGLGVLGDSLSDEYPAGLYAYASSWVELLAEQKGVNLGPRGDWGEPRGEGYQFNWARTGATTGSMIRQGMPDGLAELVNQGLVSHAVMAVGQNDFFFTKEPYLGIYSGTWSDAQIEGHLDHVVGNVRTALATLSATGVDLVLSNVADFGVAPLVRFLLNSPERRERVAGVVRELNSRLDALARQFDVPLVDLDGLSQELLGTNRNPIPVQSLGGNLFYNTVSFGPNTSFVFDGIHPNTVAQAVFANLFLEGFASGYQTPVDPFSEAQIVGLLGLPYRGDTAEFVYSDFVSLPEAAEFDLGPVDFAQRDDLDPSAGEVWYRFQTTHEGLLTAEASLADPGQIAMLSLYDENLHKLVDVLPSDGTLRIDRATAAGETYYVRLLGAEGRVDLRLANLVRQADGRVTVFGTDGPDRFTFRPAGPYRVTINGVAYDFDPAAVGSVVFHAGGGQDTVAWHGSAGSDVLEARPHAATLAAADFSLEADGFESLTVDALEGAADVAFLRDSPGRDTFTATPREAVLAGEGFALAAVGFDFVHAYALNGGYDEARLSGSPGDDTLVAYWNFAKLYNEEPSQPFFARAKYFESVQVDGGGGRDVAYLSDSPTDDVFLGRPQVSRLAASDGRYDQRIAAFEEVYAKAVFGGHDEAYLLDSPGDDVLEAEGKTARLRANNAEYDFLYDVTRFEAVRAVSSEGLDLAFVNPAATFLEPLGNWRVAATDVQPQEFAGGSLLRWEDAAGRPLDALAYGDEVALAVYAPSLAGTEIALTVYEDDLFVDDLVQDGLAVTIGPDGVGRTAWRVPWQNDIVGDPEYFFEAAALGVASRSLGVREIPGGVSFLRDGFFALAPWQAVLGEAIPVIMGYVNGLVDLSRPDLDFAEVRLGPAGTKVDLYSAPSGGVDLGVPSDPENSRQFQEIGGRDFLEVGVEPWWYTVGYLQPDDYAAYVVDGSLSIEVTYHWRHEWLDPVKHQTVAPLVVDVVSGLPAWDGWHAGDTHFHSDITNDFDTDAFHAVDLGGLENLIGVLFGEYGAPLALTSVLATAVGLDWITVTDHSFEVDGSNDDAAGPEGDWYRDLSDPLDYQQSSTEYLWEDLQASPVFDEFMFLKGVELSVAAPLPHEPLKLPELFGVPSAQLHMLTYGFDPNDPVIKAPGFGSRMRDLADVMPDLEAAGDPGGPVFAYAAHPALRDSVFAESWQLADVLEARGFSAPGDGQPEPLLRGLEFWNGRGDTGRDESLALWERVLDEIMQPGQGVEATFPWYLAAGSDEHLSRNRPGQSRVGDVRTVLAAGALDRSGVLAALYHGRALVTDGPWFAMGIDTNGDADFMDFGTDVMLGGQAVVTDPAQGRLLFDWPDQAATKWGPVSLGDVRLVHYDDDGVRDPHGDFTLGTDPEYFDPQANTFDAYRLWNDQGRQPGWQAYRAELRLGDAAGERFEAFTNPIWVYFDVPSSLAEVYAVLSGTDAASLSGGNVPDRSAGNNKTSLKEEVWRWAFTDAPHG